MCGLQMEEECAVIGSDKSGKIVCENSKAGGVKLTSWKRETDSKSRLKKAATELGDEPWGYEDLGGINELLVSQDTIKVTCGVRGHLQQEPEGDGQPGDQPARGPRVVGEKTSKLQIYLQLWL